MRRLGDILIILGLAILVYAMSACATEECFRFTFADSTYVDLKTVKKIPGGRFLQDTDGVQVLMTNDQLKRLFMTENTLIKAASVSCSEFNGMIRDE